MSTSISLFLLGLTKIGTQDSDEFATKNETSLQLNSMVVPSSGVNVETLQLLKCHQLSFPPSNSHGKMSYAYASPMDHT